MTFMNWNDWRPFYEGIVSDLNLDVQGDIKATEMLTAMLEKIDPSPLLQKLDSLIRNRIVVVCGAGPSLEEHLDVLLKEKSTGQTTFIASDGAATVMLDRGCQCDILVTDLDGPPETLMKCAESGSLIIVHGHGDNISTVRQMVPVLGDVLGSTQVSPTHRTFLWGGFTDGDRACFLATHYGPKEIILAGMDLGEIVGRWSKPGHSTHFPASERKKIKLRIAERLLEHLFSTTTIKYRDMRSGSTEAGGLQSPEVAEHKK